ncbi:MMPL family transporter [Cumulibacter soli]|uniref:MMPL family transporter n=1 Tax=Cumulibacter soli TaxID=2546344 RepID=UPI0010676AE3|nr:MMPL family transporter [Cumulibacter soli]
MTSAPRPSPEPTSARRRSRVRVGPALIVALVIAAWLSIAGLGGASLGSLGQVTSNDESSWLPESAESVLANAKLAELDDTGALPALVVLLGDSVGPDLPNEGGTQPGGSTSPGSDPSGGPESPYASYGADVAAEVYIDDVPLNDLLAVGQSVTAVPANDGSGILLIVPLDAKQMGETLDDGESQLAMTVDQLRESLTQVTGAEQIFITGPAGFANDISAAFAGIDGVLLLVTLSVVLIILLLVYRSVVLPLIVLFTSVSGLALAGFVVYRLAKADVLVVSGQTQGILFILVVGAATDYGLLLVARYREELERHERPLDAMKVAWRACLEPIAASAGTVIAALLCLTLSDLNSNQGLGPVGAIGIVAALVAALTLLPALLLLGRGVFWPRIPRFGHDPVEKQGLWARISHLVEARPRQIWLTVAAILIAFCFAVPTFKANGTSEAEVFMTEVDAVTGQEILDERFDAAAADPIQILVPAIDAGSVADAVENVEGVEGVSVGSQETSDGYVEVRVIAEDAGHTADLVTEIRPIVHATNSDAMVGGRAAVDVDTRETAQRDLTVIIPVVLVVVLVILIALLRAIVAPLMLITATAVSFGTALGVSALVFNHVLDFPGADPTVPLLGFIFLVALGVDYSIFLMTRAREEVGTLGPRDGVAHALRVTGPVITNAGVVLAATFAALSVLPLLFMVQIAFVVAFGVLLDTLVVRSFLVPAMAIDAGRHTWWPSRLSADRGTDRAAGKEFHPTHT